MWFTDMVVYLYVETCSDILFGYIFHLITHLSPGEDSYCSRCDVCCTVGQAEVQKCCSKGTHDGDKRKYTFSQICTTLGIFEFIGTSK